MRRTGKTGKEEERREEGRGLKERGRGRWGDAATSGTLPLFSALIRVVFRYVKVSCKQQVTKVKTHNTTEMPLVVQTSSTIL